MRLALLLLVACGGVRYSGPPSDHFDGARFFNQGIDEPSAAEFLRWMGSRAQGAWPDWVDDPHQDKPPERAGSDLRVTWIGHASVLIQIDGKNILADPVWSERVGPVSFAGPKRVRPPGVAFDDLPPIDAVIVSHNHYDHMDVPTLRRLAARDKPRIFTALGNRAELAAEAIDNVTELDWWGGADIGGGVRVISVPVQHFSRRGLADSMRTLWCGFVIVAPSGKIYFAGDTGMGDHFRAVGERYGPFRLALLPIGAYAPRWFMHRQHIDPAQAIEAARALNAQTAVAMHYDTFPLADEAFGEAPRELWLRLRRSSDAPRFWTPKPGEGRLVP